jgi:hypothetical protein
MSNETGTAAVTGWINTSIIQGLVAWYLLDAFPAQKVVRIEPIMPGTATAAFSRVTKQTALSTTITELTGLSNTAFGTDKVTAAIAEVGILRQFTKLGQQTNIFGPDGLIMAAVKDGIQMCLEKFETDVWAQATNASTSVGTSGQAFTVANFAAGISQLAINKAKGDIVALLTTTQAKDLRADIVSSGAAVFAAGAGNGIMQRVGDDGYMGTVFGVPAYTNNLGLVSGSDTLGEFLTDGNRSPEFGATGVALGWMPEMSQLAQPAFSGGIQLAVTMAYGMVEVLDGAYTKITTKT